jgi:hypothetical protein
MIVSHLYFETFNPRPFWQKAKPIVQEFQSLITSSKFQPIFSTSFLRGLTPHFERLMHIRTSYAIRLFNGIQKDGS